MNSKPLDYAGPIGMSRVRSIFASAAIRISIVLLATAAFIQLESYRLRGDPIYSAVSGDYGLITGAILAITGIVLASVSFRARRSKFAILIIVAACVWGYQPIIYR